MFYFRGAVPTDIYRKLPLLYCFVSESLPEARRDHRERAQTHFHIYKVNSLHLGNELWV